MPQIGADLADDMSQRDGMSTVSKKKKVKKLKKKKGIPAESRAYDNLESGNSNEEVDR